MSIAGRGGRERGEQLPSLQSFLSFSKGRVIRRGKFRFPELEVETQQWQTHLETQSTSGWEQGGVCLCVWTAVL